MPNAVKQSRHRRARLNDGSVQFNIVPRADGFNAALLHRRELSSDGTTASEQQSCNWNAH